MSHPALYWIDGPWAGRLAVAPRPRGGDWLEDEVAGWKRAGIDVVASLLTDEENVDLELTAERSVVDGQALSYVSLPIPDRDIPPSGTAALETAIQLANELARGRSVVIHCRQGIGRSASIAAAVLAASGVPAEDALRRIGAARGLPVPETDAQREWVYAIARIAAARAA